MSGRCWFGIHDWEAKSHWNRSLWCEVQYECRRCGSRAERHEDHWVDKHEERKLSAL